MCEADMTTKTIIWLIFVLQFLILSGLDKLKKEK